MAMLDAAPQGGGITDDKNLPSLLFVLDAKHHDPRHHQEGRIVIMPILQMGKRRRREINPRSNWDRVRVEAGRQQGSEGSLSRGQSHVDCGWPPCLSLWGGGREQGERRAPFQDLPDTRLTLSWHPSTVGGVPHDPLGLASTEVSSDVVPAVWADRDWHRPPPQVHSPSPRGAGQFPETGTLA